MCSEQRKTQQVRALALTLALALALARFMSVFMSCLYLIDISWSGATSFGWMHLKLKLDKIIKHPAEEAFFLL